MRTRPDATVRAMIRLEALGPRHLDALLAGQDEALVAEAIGAPWTRASLSELAARAVRWRADGPLRQFVAVEERDDDEEAVVGGGGLRLLGPGLARGEADASYWVLARHRGRGLGAAIGCALIEQARADQRIRTLVLRISPDNSASQAVARGLGARSVGRAERHPADALRAVERWELRLR